MWTKPASGFPLFVRHFGKQLSSFAFCESCLASLAFRASPPRLSTRPPYEVFIRGEATKTQFVMYMLFWTMERQRTAFIHHRPSVRKHGITHAKLSQSVFPTSPHRSQNDRLSRASNNIPLPIKETLHIKQEHIKYRTIPEDSDYNLLLERK